MCICKKVALAILLLLSAPSFSRELVPEKILSQRSGKTEGAISQSINAFRGIDSNATIHVTVDLPADPEDFLAAESFYKSFVRNFPNALFNPSQEGISIGDYVVFVSAASVSDTFDRDIQEYRTEATGVACDRQYHGRISCKETGRKRVPAGVRTVTLTASIYGVSSHVYVVDSEGRLERVRSGDSTVVLTGRDNCRNISNVYASIAYMLGSQPFSSRPEKLTYRVYPNQLGCYDNENIELK